MKLLNISTEDYLETILLLGRRLPAVRAIDIATELGYSKSSVSTALKNLRDKDYITVGPHNYITLTEKGTALAASTYERHEWFTKWLISLGVTEKTAARDACQIEHALSAESFNAIKNAIPEI
ncbi:MAG: metal-dependent transcriptional regulator [Firmicutes bacterium]|nr:metal-dependent transcriptional regulator [Bacillota bacterium]